MVLVNSLIRNEQHTWRMGWEIFGRDNLQTADYTVFVLAEKCVFPSRLFFQLASDTRGIFQLIIFTEIVSRKRISVADFSPFFNPFLSESSLLVLILNNKSTAVLAVSFHHSRVPLIKSLSLHS